MNTTEASAMEHLADLVRDIDVAMLTTVDRTGRLHSRPMMTLHSTTEGALWFFTQACSHMADDVQGHHPVNLSYVDSARGIYISVSGRARVIHDKAKKSELWERRLARWLPQGPDDAEVILLRIEVQEAEYWSSGTAREFTAAIEVSASNGGVRNEKILFH